MRTDPIGLMGGNNLHVYVQNNPVNLVDPYGLEVFEVNDLLDTGFNNRSPDYYALTVSYGFGLMVFEVDAYGNFYMSPLGGGSVGNIPSNWRGLPGVSLMSGWIDECGNDRPPEDELRRFLSGFSRNLSTGYIFGAGYTWAGGKRAFELGLTTPQIASFNVSLSVEGGHRPSYNHRDYLMP